MKIAEIKGIFNSKFSSNSIIADILNQYMKKSILKSKRIIISEEDYSKKVIEALDNQFSRLKQLYSKINPIIFDKTDNYSYFIFEDSNYTTVINNDLTLNIVLIYENGTVDKTIKNLYKRINKIIGFSLKFAISENVPCKLYNCNNEECVMYDKNYYIILNFENKIDLEIIYSQAGRTALFLTLTIASYAIFRNEVNNYIAAFNSNSTLEISIKSALLTNFFSGFLCTFIIEFLCLIGICVRELLSNHIKLLIDPDIVMDNLNNTLSNTFTKVGSDLEKNTYSIPDVG